MHNKLRSTLICIALAHGALYPAKSIAADFPNSRNSSPVYSVPRLAANWQGLYLGLNTHYGWGKAKSANLSGFGLGGHLGYNFQSGPGVFGVEGDFGYTGIDHRGFTEAFRQKWLGSGRLRAGYAFERFLPYVTAGFAYTTGTMKTATGKDDQGHFGYVIGAGVEAMLTDRVSARVEFLHYGFGSQNYAVPAVRRTSVQNNMLRFGMSYKF
ncbi:MAG: porin family protein [Methylobacterium sp.]|jgi:outer membrane immunogenic protein|nr:porin family protein [Methylobacterium sp.]MCA3602051.1 porin family protein [Methylobacterium sp.]MCA3611348.1 porin family protein [Methylobacterium sp.]MCA3614828.1 porin family protein [Methylobacterium sp.]MCA4910968.1 porin family protein [Methylobacterium sp.]